MKNLFIVLLTVTLVAIFATSCATYAGSGSTVPNPNVTVYALNDVPSNCSSQGTITTADVSVGQILLTYFTLGIALTWDFGPDYRAMAVGLANALDGVNAIAPLSKKTFEAYSCP